MEEVEGGESQISTIPISYASSTPTATGDSGASSSTTAAASTEIQPQTRHPFTAGGHRLHRFRRYRRSFFRHHSPPRNGPYRFNVSLSDGDMSDDVWSCLIVLVTFWFFASITLILGFYGSLDLQLGPNTSRLITANQLFVQSIKAEQEEQQIKGPMLYGFHKMPSLDVETKWFETHNASVQSNFHKEWVFSLNPGSEVEISYEVKHPTSFPLSLVIAQGQESLIEWIEDPSFPNTTLSWNMIHGSGRIVQKISQSSTYYIALGNLDSSTVEVELNFTIKALLYDTTNAYFRCSVYNRECCFSLVLFKSNAVVLTSPGPEEVENDDGWYIGLSYGPRWATYFLGAGIMTTVAMLLFRFCNMCQPSHEDGSLRQTGADNQEPLITPKDDDVLSLGSSYDSVSNGEEDLEEWTPEEGKQPKEGENSINPRKLCVICFDSPRDCFFLPCGHCAACFDCGSRIAEEDGICPICRRRMKKVRKIFSGSPLIDIFQVNTFHHLTVHLKMYLVARPQASPSLLLPNFHRSNHRRRKKLYSTGIIKATWQELAGVLVFSAIPFTAVKLIANSPLGRGLQQRLLEKKKEAVEISKKRLALCDQARRDSRWYGEERPRWLGPISFDYPSHLNGQLPGDYGFDIAGLAKDPVNLQKYYNFEILHARWAMLAALGVVIPEVLNLVGAFQFVEPVWWRGDTLDYLGIPGFHLAGSQGVIVIAICQVLLMVGPEYARYCGIEALEPLGIYLPGDINYPGGLLFDPLNLSEDPTTFEELKIKEMKNGRLAMVAWLGFYAQAIVTQKGPIENLVQHISDPLHNNILSYLNL
ncbi:hypothetical protein V2J09_019111 [Rumex salicifolius]